MFELELKKLSFPAGVKYALDFSCPHCNAPHALFDNVVAIIYCDLCGAQMPDVEDLVSITAVRLEYHVEDNEEELSEAEKIELMMKTSQGMSYDTVMSMRDMS